ncbi:MAG TPA: hypothetical protein VIX59_18435 [Candidatus Binataceae bacterium]
MEAITARTADHRSRRGLAASAALISLLAIGGCSTSSSSSAVKTFDLSKCEVLEPSLYRCPGYDAPLCDPDFSRNDVQCVRITKSGVALEQLGS